MVSGWRRIPDECVPARAKVCGAYVNPALAKAEAVRNGFDDAIMLTRDGHVSEASSANLFILRDGVFVTPPVTDDILEGITRGLLLTLIQRELGMRVVERSIDRSELYAAEEVLMCGTGVEIQPVVEIDHRPIGDALPGPSTLALQQVYDDVVHGENDRYADLLVRLSSTAHTGAMSELS
jgi:branched-chain amino acid aminotransferase